MSGTWEYWVDEVGRIKCASDADGHPVAQLVVEGARATSLGPLGKPARDLLRVVESAAEADRLSLRARADAPRAPIKVRWQREIALHVAVEDPDRWRRAAARLEALLSFMTDDHWRIDFDGIRQPVVIQQPLPLPDPDQVDEIALFSGGLNSVIGAAARMREGRRVLTVSQYGNNVRLGTLRRSLRSLDPIHSKRRALLLNHRLSGKKPRIAETSRRSRGAMFLVMGAAAASHLGKPGFSFYETGVGCINLPLNRTQVASQASRAMHPRTILLFERLIAMVLDRPIYVASPFFLHTKGELCQLVEPGFLAQLALVSNSCDETDARKPDPVDHCGVCMSCLFRRIARHHAIPFDDPTPYRDCEGKRGAYELAALEHHVSELEQCRSLDDIADIDPNARFAEFARTQSSPERRVSKSEVLELYGRYRCEARRFLEEARPMLGPPPRKPRRTDKGDLLDAAR